MGIELTYKDGTNISRLGDFSPVYATSTLTLADDEYITTIEGRKNVHVDYLKFTTN